MRALTSLFPRLNGLCDSASWCLLSFIFDIFVSQDDQASEISQQFVGLEHELLVPRESLDHKKPAGRQCGAKPLRIRKTCTLVPRMYALAETLIQDVRYALRLVVRKPGFAAIAAMSVATALLFGALP